MSGTASEANRNGYTAYLELTPPQQAKLLERIQIVDNSVDIQELLKKIQYHLRFIAPVGHEAAIFEQVSGWWMIKSIQLLTDEFEYISYNELKHRLDEIRDSVTRDNLPDDFPDFIDTADLSVYDENTFIKQLKLVNCGSRVLRSAISDFRRAFEQRSKWIRQNNCTVEELRRFDKQLYDYWQRLFSILQDETEGFENALLVTSGYDFYKKYFVEMDIPVRIREKFTSPYLSKGSCQILSDEKRIGWHPNYQELLD